ncbi:hypothetical protein V3589_15060 [Sinorhizobium fredii]|uniref:hypothetical protein n=1 Tax=Rhizobium fredii TaxID=380 RepID=UPI0030B13CAC
MTWTIIEQASCAAKVARDADEKCGAKVTGDGSRFGVADASGSLRLFLAEEVGGLEVTDDYATPQGFAWVRFE